jgi:energy-coupling factor transport system substrate-specific component
MSIKKIIKYIILLIIIPIIMIMGITVFDDKMYMYISAVIVILSCVPFFMTFERQKDNVDKVVILAVMVTLIVIGRYCFMAMPSFKPVTAMVIITGVYFGGEIGYLSGALSALVSNMIFTQGPWTPFQMFAWGIIGLIAGIFGRWFRRYPVLTVIYGGLSGILFSMIMDIQSSMWHESTFNFKRYITYVVAATPVTITYIISNVIFMIIIFKPMGKVLNRIKQKANI